MPNVLSNTPAHSTAGLRFTLAGMVVMMAAASAPSPFYPLLQQAIGFTPLTLTAIFAVYTATLLVSLLIMGSLSDHIGRRPVISAGFALMAASLFVFWHAQDVTGLILARVLQGVAAGLLMSTLSAAVVDFEPMDRPGSASIWNSVVPLGGLALGALVSGVLLDATSSAKATVFGALVGGCSVLALLVWSVPETAPRHEGV